MGKHVVPLIPKPIEPTWQPKLVFEIIPPLKTPDERIRDGEAIVSSMIKPINKFEISHRVEGKWKDFIAANPSYTMFCIQCRILFKSKAKAYEHCIQKHAGNINANA
jgi:hypothetical protein